MTEQQSERLIRACNDAWQQRDWATLSECFHPQAVLLPPDAGDPIVGRDPILETYKEFMAAAKVTSFTIGELVCFPFSATSMVHMRFTLGYQLNDEALTESGLEVYAINSEGTDAQIVWRSQMIL
jgi:ketosteroid isomerase-like protein